MQRRMNRSTPNTRKPRVYLCNRKCCICGSDKTYERAINLVVWHRDVDDDGKWTGKWKCNRCYYREYAEKRREKEVEIKVEKMKEKEIERIEKIEQEKIEQEKKVL